MGKETQRKFRYRLGRRTLAFVMAVVMLGGMILAWQVQIHDTGMQFVGTVLERAQQVTSSNTAYLDQSTLERAWRVLKATVSKPDTYEEYDTYASLAIAKGDYSGAIPYMQGCIDTCADGDRALAVLWLRQGSLHILCDDYDMAIGCFDEALALDSGLTDAYLLRAQMKNEQGKLEEAAENLKRYLELAGDNPVIQAALAGLYESTGSFERAVECYTLAIDSGNYDVNNLASRGRCRILIGEVEAARKDLERFFREDGKDPKGDYLAMLGMCHMEAEDYKSAVRTLHSAIDHGYQDTYLIYSQSTACAYVMEDYDLVLTDGAKALEAAPVDADTSSVLKWMGFAHFARSEMNEAADRFAQALSQNGDLEFVNYYAGVACMTAERYKEAVSYFKVSAQRMEHASTCLYNAALCLLQQELAEEAMDALREAIRAHDDDQAVQEAESLLAVMEDYTKTLER